MTDESIAKIAPESNELNYTGQKHPHCTTIYYPNGTVKVIPSDPRGILDESSFGRLILIADDLAKEGNGYTKEEWDARPEQYVGHCLKQCYSEQVMQKGHVLEFGVRGVYVCMNCGYAYPPMCEPCDADLDQLKIEIEECDDEDEKKFLIEKFDRVQHLLEGIEE
jgi:hypothetical protein